MVVSHHRLSSIVGLVACAIASAACKPQPAPASGAYAPPTSGRCARNGGTSNNLPMNNLPMNGLSQASLAKNKPLLDALKNRQLRSDIFVKGQVDPAFLSANEYSAQLMKYIASCALDPCDWIDAPDALAKDPTAKLADYSVISGNEADRKRKGFVGELGLCGANSGEASWAGHLPSGHCLERVSGCMLARTNALQAKVMISLRGTGMELSDRVPTNTMYRENNGTPIASFAARATCQPEDLTHGQGNCGWQPLLVGQCVHDLPGSGAREVVIGGAERSIELRVCAGIFGCDDRSGHPLTTVNGGKETPVYAGELIGAGVGGAPFQCPANGPPDADGHGTGYFAVMARSREGAAVDGDTITARFATPGFEHDRYPARETDVFTFREGSFFGNLFTKLPPKEETRERMLGGDQFACFSNIWSEGVAMFEQRICAGVTKLEPNGCFENIPGPCDASPGPRRPCPKGAPCLQQLQMNPGVCTPTKDLEPIAAQCKSVVGPPVLARTAPSWRYPYTTYLNAPCDLGGPRCPPFVAPPAVAPIP